jgi:hypothetical protein
MGVRRFAATLWGAKDFCGRLSPGFTRGYYHALPPGGRSLMSGRQHAHGEGSEAGGRPEDSRSPPQRQRPVALDQNLDIGATRVRVFGMRPYGSDLPARLTL